MAELLRAPRGTTDILPPETLKWSFVERIARRFADQYGFEEVRTPLFEHTELFARGIGEGTDIVAKEMYTFTDKGGRSLTLRPELTAPAMRAYLENQLTQQSIVKWFYIGPGFRYERPQSGRFRQFHQFGVEAIGSLNPGLDAEVIALAVEIFRQLELRDLTVKLNSIGCRACRPSYRDKLREYFSAYRDSMCEDCKNQRFEKNPLRILDCKVPACRPVIEKAPLSSSSLCAECETHFQKVQSWLELFKIPISRDPYLVRGLEYYTKTVFEVVSTSLGSQNSLCGGGRYDDLVETLGGPSRPAVGFAAGLERIVMVMENNQATFPKRSIDLFAIALGEKAEKVLLPAVLSLRRGGLRVRLDYHQRSLAAQLKEAAQLDARWALIVGENELNANTALIRNMQTREQRSIPLSDLERSMIATIVSSGPKGETVAAGEKLA